MTRRALLLGGAAAVGAAALPAGVLGALPAAAVTEPYRRDTYKPLVGQTMRMVADGQATDVVLAKIRDLSPIRRTDDQDRFALEFHTTSAAGHPAGGSGGTTFHFVHDQLGALLLFAAPVGPNDVAVYETIINRA